MYSLLQRCLIGGLLLLGLTAARAQPPSSMRTVALRLRPGQDLKAELDTYVRRHRLSAVCVLTCVGSLTKVPLRYANQEAGTVLTGHFEIVSLTGVLSGAGSHLHVAVADSTGRTFGGHLLDGSAVYTTAELVLGVLPGLEFAREPDPQTGYRELVIRKKLPK
jgi:predicted DNA-binding protein with PD1-like motif